MGQQQFIGTGCNETKRHVLDHVMATCKKYWQGKTYDSFLIKVVIVPCNKVSPLETSHNLRKTYSSD